MNARAAGQVLGAVHLSFLSREEKLGRAFAVLDTDSSGALDLAELQVGPVGPLRARGGTGGWWDLGQDPGWNLGCPALAEPGTGGGGTWRSCRRLIPTFGLGSRLVFGHFRAGAPWVAPRGRARHPAHHPPQRCPPPAGACRGARQLAQSAAARSCRRPLRASAP